MLALSDDQLVIVMDAAADLSPEKRAVFLERVAARLGLHPRFTAAEFDRVARFAARQVGGLMPPRRFPPPWSVTRNGAIPPFG